jgi:hypothetical protein
LLWALTSYGYGAKPIHRLQTSAFPLSSRFVPNPETKHWRFASPADRRCLFASALSIFGRPSVSQILHGSAARCEQLGGWLEFALSLTQKHIRDLERRSWYWPPTAHNAFRRAILLAQSGSRIPFHAGRSNLPISGSDSGFACNETNIYGEKHGNDEYSAGSQVKLGRYDTRTDAVVTWSAKNCICARRSTRLRNAH